MSKTIEFSDKEIAQVWSIVAWFHGLNDKKPVSGSLVQKLYPGDENKLKYSYDEQIENRIIEIADFLVRKREHDKEHAEAKA